MTTRPSRRTDKMVVAWKDSMGLVGKGGLPMMGSDSGKSKRLRAFQPVTTKIIARQNQDKSGLPAIFMYIYMAINMPPCWSCAVGTTRFEWNVEKDATNQRKLGVAFVQAQYAFADSRRVMV